MQRIVIAGFGFMGGMHAQAYAAIPRARVVGVVAADPARAQAQLDRLGLAVPVLDSLDAALDRLDPDAVDVCLPTDRHAAAALTALRRRKHVFCEKPLCASPREAAALRAAAARARTRVMVGHCIRFWPEYQALAAFHASGRGGRLLSLTMQRRSARPRYSAGDWLGDPRRSLGAAVDLHIHDTDFALHLLGTPAAVESCGTRDRTGWSHIFTTYRYPGVRVTAEGGWNYPAQWGFQMAFQAVFERAAIEFDSRAAPTLRLTMGARAPAPMPFKAPAAGTSRSGTGNLSALGGYYNELRYFIACLERGTAPRIATLADGIESLRVVTAEIRSARTGRAVRL